MHSESKAELTCRDNERERTMDIPGNVGTTEARAKPHTVVVSRRIEHARSVLGILDGFMESDDVQKPHLLHLFVRDGLADARDDAGERPFIPVRLQATPKGFGSAIRSTLDLPCGHERDLAPLSGDEAMVFVVTVLFRGQQTRPRPVVDMDSGSGEPLDFLIARKVEAVEREHDVAVLVELERGLRTQSFTEHLGQRFAVLFPPPSYVGVYVARQCFDNCRNEIRLLTKRKGVSMMCHVLFLATCQWA